MKFSFKTLALMAVAGLTLSTVSSKAAVVTYDFGDLVMGFTASGGTGSTSVYLVNIGAATSYRDATSNSFNINNIGTDLTNTFGSGWHERTDLYFGLIAVRSNSAVGAAVNGDPVRTVYASAARPDVATQSTGWGSSSPIGSATRAAISNSAKGMENEFDTANATGNSGGYGAVMSTSGINTWDELNPPVAGTSFSGLNPSIQQTFASGTWGNFGNGNVEGALDLYRILNSTSGASPTGTVGVGSYEGTFTLNDQGQIDFYAPVPEPSTYAMLAAGAGFMAFFYFRRRRMAAK